MKHLLHYLLVVLFLFAIPQLSMADTWDGTTAIIWTSGSGTETNPYLIENAANLAYLATKVNAGTTYSGKYFKMTVDIDLNATTWTGIGTTETKSFKGTFDGDGHSIIGINTATALFNYVKDATIINLSTAGIAKFSGIISNAYGATEVSNCNSLVCCSGGSLAGGIIGKSNSTSTVSNCGNTGAISSSGCSGGIIGLGTANITNCYNSGDINTSRSYQGSIIYNEVDDYSQTYTVYCGGLIGQGGGSITNSYNAGNIIGSSSANLSVNVSSTSSYYTTVSYAGGIIGYSTSGGSISQCYNKGIIRANATTYATYSNSSSSYSPNSSSRAYAAGILGGGTGTCTITYCYNRNENIAGASAFSYYNNGVSRNTSKESTTTSSAGIGIGTSNRITNCYNTGSLSTSGYRIGNGTITNCYYLETCTGTGSGTSKSDLEMKSTTMPGLLNATDNIFMMDVTPNVNDGYPIFGNSTYLVTNDATNVSHRSATLNGLYYSPTQPEVQGFEYKKSTDEIWDSVHTSIGTPFEYGLRELEHGTTYRYRAFANKDGVFYYGEEKTFSTLTCESITVSISASTRRICQGDSASFVATGTSAASDTLIYMWSTGFNDAEIIATEAGTYQVTVTDENGCSATKSITLTVDPLPEGTINGNTSICAGNTTTLTAPEAATHVWSTGDESSTIATDSAGLYTCISTSSQGCAKTDTVVITVNPVYPNEIIRQSICEGSSYNFFETLLTDAGEYSYNGTTVDGCDSTVFLTLAVNPLPIATINGDTSFCEGESSILTATGGVSYVWNNGTTTQSITVTNGGAYSVTATDANGCSNTVSTVVTARPLPDITISGNTVFCESSSTTLTAQGADSYLWNTGSSNASIPVYNAGSYSVTGTSTAGCTKSTSVTVTENPVYNLPITEAICYGNSYNFFGQNLATSGSYTYTLQTHAGCDSTINLTLTVNPLPTVTISGNTTFCEGGSTPLTATGGVSYMWSNGDTTSVNTITNAGIYGVTVTDANGCTGTASTAVTENTLPTISISGNTAFCEGSSTVLTAQGGNSYTWSNDAQTAYITVTSSGNYTVTGVGSNGCSNTASVSVSANPLPTITINGNTSFCQGGSTTLTATGADSYTWNNGTTTPSITVDAFGIYSVIGSTAIGCTGTARVTVTVSPNPTITISGDTELCPDETTTLTANGGTSYMWFDGTTSATYQTSTAGSYSVIGYNDAGCHTMATAEVEAYPDAESEETATATGSYTWNGETYTESGDYTFVTTTAHGCDSTVTLHLTIEEGGNDGIDDISADDIKVYVNGRNIVIEGSLDESVMVYDVMGRTIYHDVVRAPITAPAAGVYMVKIGDAKARKVVILR